MKSLTHIKTGIGCALSLLFVNAAFADATSDARIQAYKSNKLIPENIVLPTSTNATDSQMIVAFSAGNLKWDSGTASQIAMNALATKYDGWTINDITTAMGPEGTYDWDTYGPAEDGWIWTVTPEIESMRQFLSAVASGTIVSDKITQLEAKEQLQAQFNTLCDFCDKGCFVGINFGKFPCDSIDIFPYHLIGDFSACTGLTASKLLTSVSFFDSVKLPAIDFTRATFSGKIMHQVDFSTCKGITSELLLSAESFSNSTLPAVDFTGADFSGRDIGGVNFIKCTGITSEQIGSCSNVFGIHITSAQYAELKDTLNTNFSGNYIYVDEAFIRLKK